MRALFAPILALSLLACSPVAEPRSASPTPSPSPSGEVSLVESVPIETDLDHPDIPDAHEVWVSMMNGARRTLDVASFYVSTAPGQRLEAVLAAIEGAADRGVAVRVLVDKGFATKYPEPLERLGKHRGIALRKIDVGAAMGGVMHAKYFLVDGQEAYVGSQNLDWRSITHIHEMGARIRDARATAAYARVFEMDWALAGGEPPRGPVAGPLSFTVTAAGEPATLTLLASPTGHLPDPSMWELPRLLALIDQAKREVHVQVLTYKTKSRDGSPFHDLDDALRRAAKRGVKVELLVSDWSKRKGTVEDVQALARVPNVAVRFLDIPPWSGGFVPFARVAHAKYMVVDGASAWIGTSNWEGDYFTRSRNLGLVVEGRAFAAKLDRVFRGAFDGKYAEVVDPDGKYEPPRVN
jgi:phosphatidylserine/phosphatidylglycerophosphate/cardiolipin synthase-like enzyme